MIYLTKYNSENIYVSPSGKVYDAPSVLQDFPATAVIPYVVETDSQGVMMFGMYALTAMRDRYDIDSELPEDDAIEALAEAMNAEQAAQEEATLSGESSAEERIAAALEYANLIASPVINEDDPDAE